MAQSRLEKIGTIFTRVTSLMRGGAMKPEDQPLWYVIYKAFPPQVEPRYDRPTPTTPIKPIFYKEDIVRAKFQRENTKFLATSLVHTGKKSRTQRFISIYQELEKSGVSTEELYTKALDEYTGQIPQIPLEESEDKNSETEKKPISKMDLSKILAE